MTTTDLELQSLRDLARRLTVALMTVYYDAHPSDEVENIVYDLFDEAQAKLGMEELIPDAQLYKKYLNVDLH